MKLTESMLRNIIKQELRKTLSSAGLNEVVYGNRASEMGEAYKDFLDSAVPRTPEAIDASLQDTRGIYQVTDLLALLAEMKELYGGVHAKLRPLAAYVVRNADKIKQAVSTLKDPFDTSTKSEAMRHLEILAGN